MNCPMCGSQVAPGEMFCPVCGSVVSNQQQPPKPQQPQPAQPIPDYMPGPVVAPQPPKKEKAKKSNTALKIIIAVLVVIMLAVGGLFAFDFIMYKKEVENNEIITEFPILKQETDFVVYNEESFPSTNYRITVERVIGGDILKCSMFRQTKLIIDDTSTEPVYSIDFEEDGKYIITIEDISEKGETETTQSASADSDADESETQKPSKVIIEAEVDDSSDDSIDKVDINSRPGDDPVVIPENIPTQQFIEATDEDIQSFSEMVYNMYWGACKEMEQINYDSATSSAQFVVDNLIIDPFRQGYENFYSLTDSILDEEHTYADSDPLYEFEYGCVRIPEEQVKWICENIYNVKYDSLATDEVTDTLLPGAADHYLHDGYYYQRGASYGDVTEWEVTIKDYAVVDGKYVFTVESLAHNIDDYDVIDFRCTKKITAEIKEIGGERYWSIYKIELVDTQTETPENKVEFDEITGTYKGSYFAAQGETGLTLTVYTEGEQLKALFDFYNLPGKSNVQSGKYYMDVTYDTDSDTYTFTATEWIEKPSTYSFVNLKGQLVGDVLSGESPTSFSVSKTAEEQTTTTDWVTAYRDFLTDYMNNPNEYIYSVEYTCFSLCYIDNDDIPEIVIGTPPESAPHVAGAAVYAYHNGEVVSICSGGEYGAIDYVERGNMICSSYTGMGIISISTYEISDGAGVCIWNGYNDAAGVPEDQQPTYESNGNAVTSEEFNEAAAKYFPTEKFTSSNENCYILNSENITRYVTN